MFEIENNLCLKYSLPDFLRDLLSLRDKFIYELSQEDELQDLSNHELVCIAQALALKCLYRETVDSFPQETARTFERLTQLDKYHDENIQDRIHQFLQEQDSRRGTHHGQRNTDTSVHTRDKS